MIAPVIVLASLAMLLFGSEGLAQEPAPHLPSLAACPKRSHPVLPEKWHGAYLMAPFSKAQLTLADVIQDDSAEAMRVRLWGLKRGSLDLLVKGRKTYVLGEGDEPAATCRDLGDTGLRPLRRDWLGQNARCEGVAEAGGVPLEWWKTPSSSRPAANWIWYKAADRSPFRIMVTQPGDELSILGWYSFSYQVRFEALRESGLGAAVAACEAKAEAAEETGRPALQKMIAGMERSEARGDTAIAGLMPGLDSACATATLPRWPEHMSITALMTAPGFEASPLPTEVLYSGGGKTMRTRSFWPANSQVETDDALLLDGYGFSVARGRRGQRVCAASLPGAVRPNWPETGGCSCEASIGGNTELTPYGPARIYVCPMTAPRVLWVWFAESGRPMVFMETSAPEDKPEGVLTLADYMAFEPGRVAGIGAFKTPAECQAPMAAAAPPKSPHAAQASPRRCGACHLDEPGSR